MTLYLVPPTPEVMEQYFSLHAARQLEPVPPVGAMVHDRNDGVFIVAEGGVLVLGVRILDTPGPFAFIEGLVTNPDVPAIVRGRALELCVSAVVTRCATAVKMPMVFTDNRRLAKFLVRRGFGATQAFMLRHSLFVEQKQVPKRGGNLKIPVHYERRKS